MGADAFQLDQFAPVEDARFRLRKHGEHVFVVDGDPDTGVVARMLRIEQQIRSADDELQVAEAAEEGKQVLLELVRERDHEVAELQAGMQEVLAIFSLVLRGRSVADAVAKAILSPDAGEDAKDDSTALQHRREEGDEAEAGGEGAEVAPLPSAMSSHERSSSSDEREDGLPATGTG